MGKDRKAYPLLDSKLRKYLAKQSNKWNRDKSWRWPSVCYTLEHKLAYLEREHYLTGRYSWRGLFHDWEKPWLYLCPWLNENTIQKKHRNNSPHHVEAAKFSTVPHLVEMYIDWECAALTKPDKPLNAFETLVHFYPEYAEYMLPVCLAFNVKSIRPDIYLHSYHQLATVVEHNEEVFATVLEVLEHITEAFYYEEWALNVKKSYDLGKSIAHFNSAEIFVLVLMWHSERMGFELDFALVNDIVKQVYEEMKNHNHFTNSGVSMLKHRYDEVKLSAYRAQQN